MNSPTLKYLKIFPYELMKNIIKNLYLKYNYNNFPLPKYDAKSNWIEFYRPQIKLFTKTLNIQEENLEDINNEIITELISDQNIKNFKKELQTFYFEIKDKGIQNFLNNIYNNQNTKHSFQ
ncbi:MAG: hypothetical protein LBM05_02420, partial [Endomicrobium sp.]|nr:hypothetical protein [Endomicrobium sp.]